MSTSISPAVTDAISLLAEARHSLVVAQHLVEEARALIFAEVDVDLLGSGIAPEEKHPSALATAVYECASAAAVRCANTAYWIDRIVIVENKPEGT